MYARFGHPVYLVGSSVSGDDPVDCDVRIILPDEEYVGRYGEQWTARHRAISEWPEGMKRWAREMAKQAAWVQRYCGVCIDFQVQCESEVRAYKHDDKPRVRLDTIDDPLAETKAPAESTPKEESDE